MNGKQNIEADRLTRDTLSAKRRYDRWAGIFNFLEQSFEKMAFHRWRSRMLTYTRGRICEMGVGTGRNIPYYPADSIVTGFDISQGMMHLLGKQYGRTNGRIRLSIMDAQHMAFKDNYFDAMLATFVFCSVPDPVLALKEALRVCKPGGRLVLMEHVRMDSPVAGAIMDFLNPLAIFLFRDNINRNTLENVKRAGWKIREVRKYSGGMVNFIIAEKGDNSHAG